MSIENPNLLERIKAIENRLYQIEQRISSIEDRFGRFPPRPKPHPGSRPPPHPPGTPPEPFRF